MPLIINCYRNDLLKDASCLMPGSKYLMEVAPGDRISNGWLEVCDGADVGGVVMEVEYPTGHDWSGGTEAPAFQVMGLVRVPIGLPVELRTVVGSRMSLALTISRPQSLATVRCLICGSDQELFGFGPHSTTHPDLMDDEPRLIRQLAAYREAAGSSMSAEPSHGELAAAIRRLIDDADWERFRLARKAGPATRYGVIRPGLPTCLN